MLVGMSATMAVPVTAVMAAEGEPAATEATAAEAAVTEEAPAEEAPVEETQAEEAAPEDEAEEVQEEEAVPQVDENGEVTEAAKDAATPADFREKLSTLSFSAEVFGKYADKLTAYATSDAVDKSNLYNCEMSVLKENSLSRLMQQNGMLHLMRQKLESINLEHPMLRKCRVSLMN